MRLADRSEQPLAMQIRPPWSELRLERLALGAREMQAVLGAPFQDVGGGRSPLALAQIGKLALIEGTAEMAAEILCTTGGPEQVTRAGAVEPRIVRHHRTRQCRIVGSKAGEKLIERRTEIAARKTGAG